jgi:hypothetical protein
MEYQSEPPLPASQTSGKAVASLVLGIFSFCVTILAGIPAIILGIISLSDIDRSGGQLQGKGLAIGGIVAGAIGSCMSVLVIILVALLLPAISAARDAARRNGSINQMRQLAIGMVNHESATGRFPAAGADSNGKRPNLSWRVHILPHIDESSLYEQFHLDEPWDSDHNRALVSSMPPFFQPPGFDLEPGMTVYLAATGPSMAFQGDAPKVSDFRDGASNTILLVEVSPENAVVWTKPDDFEFDPAASMDTLNVRPGGSFLAAFADSHVEPLNIAADPADVKAKFTRAAND